MEKSKPGWGRKERMHDRGVRVNGDSNVFENEEGKVLLLQTHAYMHAGIPTYIIH